jgi:hypothetical protein
MLPTLAQQKYSSSSYIKQLADASTQFSIAGSRHLNECGSGLFCLRRVGKQQRERVRERGRDWCIQMHFDSLNLVQSSRQSGQNARFLYIIQDCSRGRIARVAAARNSNRSHSHARPPQPLPIKMHIPISATVSLALTSNQAEQVLLKFIRACELISSALYRR